MNFGDRFGNLLVIKYKKCNLDSFGFDLPIVQCLEVYFFPDSDTVHLSAS